MKGYGLAIKLFYKQKKKVIPRIRTTVMVDLNLLSGGKSNMPNLYPAKVTITKIDGKIFITYHMLELCV